MKEDLIASCGMNCGICLAYLRDNNKCPGCNSGRVIKGTRLNCSIKLCKERKGKYCFDCDKFPCDRLKRLDKRYREKYDMSEIENLEFIRDKGIRKFVESETRKWQNSKGTYCVHNKKRYQ